MLLCYERINFYMFIQVNGIDMQHCDKDKIIMAFYESSSNSIKNNISWCAKIVSELLGPSRSNGYLWIRTKGPNIMYRCGTSRKPSECQVIKWKVSMNSIMRVREFLRTWKKRRFGTYIVMNGELRSLRSRDLSLLGGFGTLGFPRF